jgi:hypothetical protein
MWPTNLLVTATCEHRRRWLSLHHPALERATPIYRRVCPLSSGPSELNSTVSRKQAEPGRQNLRSPRQLFVVLGMLRMTGGARPNSTETCRRRFRSFQLPGLHRKGSPLVDSVTHLGPWAGFHGSQVNCCGADRQPRLDDPGSFGAPGIGIDDRLACFTPTRSQVRTRYGPPIRPNATATPSS